MYSKTIDLSLENEKTPVLHMRNITKRFPGVLANNKVNFDIKVGEIHSIVGENGAGKSTLMKILYGYYHPDEGEILIHGTKSKIEGPQDAVKKRIGMVHQHLRLVPKLTVAENIILGSEPTRTGIVIDYKESYRRIEAISETYGIRVKLNKKVRDLELGEKQRVEILKVLYRNAKLLILDEPTAILTPHETENLLEMIRKMTDDRLVIVPFVSHKIREVMEISDRITVLRDGNVVGTVNASDVTKEELAKMMVGRESVFQVRKSVTQRGSKALEVRNLTAKNDLNERVLKGVTFDLFGGEVLGIAGVSGNGQRELAEVLTGMRRCVDGVYKLRGTDVTNWSPKKLIEHGIGYVPADRIETGTFPELSVLENLILKFHDDPKYCGDGPVRKYFHDRTKMYNRCMELIEEYNIKTPHTKVLCKHLSGGNIQRLVLARELEKKAEVIIANQPTRGLDIGSMETIRSLLLGQVEKGAALLLISDDLDEIIMMSDRIAVMYEGEIMAIVSPTTEIVQIGLLMAGKKEE